MKLLAIDIWSDIACPWCYVGKRRLEAALARFPERDAVEVTWHAFELDPNAPRQRDGNVDNATRLAEKYRTNVPAAEAMMQRLTEVAAGDGLELHLDRARTGNTFDAHRIIYFAGTRGAEVQDRVKERLLRATMTEGEAMGDRETLVRLSAEAGLDPAEVRALLDGSDFTLEVRADERQARALGINGVPFFIFDGKYGVSGAQTADVLLSVLDKAWSELAPAAPIAPVADGEVCTPETCN